MLMLAGAGRMSDGVVGIVSSSADPNELVTLEGKRT